MLGGIANQTDIGSALKLAIASPQTALANAVAQVSPDYARIQVGGIINESIALFLLVRTTAALVVAGDSVSLNLVLQDSDDDVTYATADAKLQPQAPLVLDGGDGTVAAGLHAFRYDLNLGSAKKYIRFSVTPTLAGTGAGNLVMVGVVTSNHLPAEPGVYKGVDGVLGSNGSTHFAPEYLCIC